MASADEAWKHWSTEEFERQMSPSIWSPNKSPDEAIAQILRVCSEETEKAKQRIPHESDIAYGSGARQKYDLYGTDLSANAPIFFWIHGGYWQECSKEISAQMAINMHEIGVKTLVCGYTLAPAATVRQIKSEVLSALEHAMKRFPTAKFFVGGHSAGGHLSASILHEPDLGALRELNVNSRLVGLLLFAGVMDLRPLVPTTINAPLKLTMDEAEKLSPLCLPIIADNVSPDVSIAVLVGKFDTPEFQRQSRAYFDALQKKFRNVEMWESLEDDHFTIVERLADLSESSPGLFVRKFIQKLC